MRYSHLIWPITGFEIAISPNTHWSSRYSLYLHSIPGRVLVSAFLIEQGALALCSVFYPTQDYLASYGSVLWLILRPGSSTVLQSAAISLFSGTIFRYWSAPMRGFFCHDLSLYHWWLCTWKNWVAWHIINVSGDSEDWGICGWLTSGNLRHVSFLLINAGSSSTLMSDCLIQWKHWSGHQPKKDVTDL